MVNSFSPRIFKQYHTIKRVAGNHSHADVESSQLIVTDNSEIIVDQNNCKCDIVFCTTTTNIEGAMWQNILLIFSGDNENSYSLIECD